MLTPPWVGFCNPEGVETCVVASPGHGDGFAYRFHAELHRTYVECNAHKVSRSELLDRLKQSRTPTLALDIQSGSFHECSRPLISCHIARLRGVGTPSFSPHRTIAPFMKSTSVSRLTRMSCNMLARCLPGAFAPFCTNCRGSPWSAIPNFVARVSPSAIRSLNSCPVGSKRVAAP